MISEATTAEAARHVKGATMAWGDGTYYDFEQPNPEVISIEDYAFGLAFTVRFRGQTRRGPDRVFYGVGQHNVYGAEELLREGHGEDHALAFLFHESGELPFGDLPGPAKAMFPGWRDHEKRHCDAINARFGVLTPDPDLIKRFDVRMFLTERRDLMPGGLGSKPITPGFEPFERVIEPYGHPDRAAARFLALYDQLRKVA
jgi:hypothetical protein